MSSDVQGGFAHRALPRELIKWLQGLDLTFPIKDYRKELMNGYLVAEIFLRYYPGKIDIHSYENSNRQERRRNNWGLLGAFFARHKLPVGEADYRAIVEDKDGEALYNFMLKVYPLLTQRKIAAPVPGQQVALPSGSGHETVSYILREKGLEKLDTSKFAQPEQDREPD
jgi:hypothetical protein